MNTYLLVVLVTQSGGSPQDAKATLSMNLTEVLPADDFEVMPASIHVPNQAQIEILGKEIHP